MLSWGFGLVLVFVPVVALGLRCFGVLPKNVLRTLAALLKLHTTKDLPEIAAVDLLPLLFNIAEI